MVETIIRQEFERSAPDVSAEVLAERIVDRVFERCRNDLVAEVAGQIDDDRYACSSLPSDCDQGAVVAIYVDDVIACFAEFFWPRTAMDSHAGKRRQANQL